MSDEKKEKEKKSTPYLPRYCTPPNKLLRYEMEPFDDGDGNGGEVRIAIFLDKKGKEQRYEAQVIWQYGWFKGITEEEFKKNG